MHFLPVNNAIILLVITTNIVLGIFAVIRLVIYYKYPASHHHKYPVWNPYKCMQLSCFGYHKYAATVHTHFLKAIPTNILLVIRLPITANVYL